MKTVLLLMLGLLIIFLGATGRTGRVLMATVFPENVVSG